MKNLVIIPARGGSKGIPGKNLKKLAGRPLIEWSIESAKNAKCVDRIIVSTDCSKIQEIAATCGAEVPFLRPAEISGDRATTESAIIHCLKFLQQEENYIPDNIILLQATSPIRSDGLIDEVFEKFKFDMADSLLTVCEFWHFLWEGKDSPRALYDYRNRLRRQDIKQDFMKFRENGSIYITNIATILNTENRLGGKISTYVMHEDESFEIDTHLDWNIVETILNSRTK